MRFIDLFAGIGGFRIALESFGHSCVFSSEIDKFARQTYSANFGHTPHGDIKKIKVNHIPKHEILCAGFPCQPFSISGKQKGFNDIRGTLFFDIIRITKYHQAKLILLENVKNLASHDNTKTLNKIISKLDYVGYDVFHKILKSSDFGVPQARVRIYFVCFRKDLSVKKFIFPKSKNRNVFLNSIIDKTETSPEFLIKRDDIKIFPKKLHTNITGLIKIGAINKGRQGERIYSIEGYAPTLSATGGGPAGKTGAYLINNRIRKLTPRECASIQGYPKKFKIPVSNNQSYKQFGNSISIPVVKAILNEIQKIPHIY